MIKFLSLSLFLMLTYALSFSQTYTDKEMRSKPLWIEMMNDTNANFYETVKAFDQYWEKREHPIEEEELIGEKKKSERQSKIARLFARNRRLNDSQHLAFEYKKFGWWRINNDGWAKPDGTLYTPEERKVMFQKERGAAK
ncbi:MAG: hypothetical protein IPO27_13315 [Bacteroidetes bacterium]|nr:hypothetical protein [Bacteroidota bacterium]